MSEACPIQTATGDLKSQVDERGPWIFTASGKRYFPASPRPEEIDIRDIAHALSQINRYTGHTRRPISVAEHCVICARNISPPYELEALLHDAAEAYLGDLSRPVKKWLGRFTPEWDCMEEENHRAVAERFQLVYPWPEAVREADNRALTTEVRDLHSQEFYYLLREGGLRPYANPVISWQPKLAEEIFLAMFYYLEAHRS